MLKKRPYRDELVRRQNQAKRAAMLARVMERVEEYKEKKTKEIQPPALALDEVHNEGV